MTTAGVPAVPAVPAPPVVRAAVDGDAEALGPMFGAYHDDALFGYLLPDAAARARLLPLHLTAYVRALLLAGEVWTTEDHAAAACWHRPGERDITPEQAAASGLDQLPRILGEDVVARMSAVFAALDARMESFGIGDHWYLALAGVAPDRQGSGLGGAVLAPALARADADRLPCYLETYAAANVPFYEKHGFGVVEHDVEPSSGLRYWLMLREAQ